MKNWQKKIPPYEGDEPYLYFAFAEADSRKVWSILRPLLERGCRVWYSHGPSGSAGELRHRQARSSGAALTILYLTDAACSDKDTKSSLLANQNAGRPLLCLDPDGKDRRLSMGLHESIPHVPLYLLAGEREIEHAILHAEGFSQEILGEPLKIHENSILRAMSLLFCVLALLLGAVSFAGYRYLNWFQPSVQDEVEFIDPVIQTAVRAAVQGKAITKEYLSEIIFLRLESAPESWDDLSMLPSLKRIVLPQQALLNGEGLPAGDYIIELSGGGP